MVCHRILALIDHFFDFKNVDHRIRHPYFQLAVDSFLNRSVYYVSFGIEVVLKANDRSIQEGFKSDSIAEQVQQISKVLEVLGHHIEVVLRRGHSA